MTGLWLSALVNALLALGSERLVLQVECHWCGRPHPTISMTVKNEGVHRVITLKVRPECQ